MHATFWLLDASDSLARQSRREPDGTGLGTFTEDGHPLVDKQPLAAYRDAEFATEARERESSTFVAHIRYASTGKVAERNTHPFCAEGRMLAHNGVIQGLDELERHLGDAMRGVRGETDSERFFALVNRETEAAGGDVTTGLRTAARWVAGSLVAGGAAAVALATPLPLAGFVAASAVVGLAAGIPFAMAFSGAAAARPDAPGAAVGFVNALASFVIVVGTPLVGLTFSLPGDGRIGFVAMGILAALASLATPRYLASA